MSRAGAPSNRRKRVLAPLTSHEIARAAALKKFRLDNGLTQEELADRLGVSQGSLSDWERARKPMPNDRWTALERIAEDVRAAQRVSGVPEPPPGPAGAETAAHEGLRAVPEAGSFPGELRANVIGADGAPPPGFGPAPAAAPADVAPGGGLHSMPTPPPSLADGGLGLPLEVTAAQLALARGPVIVYTLIAGGLEQAIDPTAGAIVGAKAEVLAISLVQAGDVNSWIARAVQLMQVGPVANCVVAHAMVVLELVRYLRLKSKVLAEEHARIRAETAPQPPPPATTIHTAFDEPQAAAAA